MDALRLYSTRQREFCPASEVVEDFGPSGHHKGIDHAYTTRIQRSSTRSWTRQFGYWGNRATGASSDRTTDGTGRRSPHRHAESVRRSGSDARIRSAYARGHEAWHCGTRGGRSAGWCIAVSRCNQNAPAVGFRSGGWAGVARGGSGYRVEVAVKKVMSATLWRA